MDKKALGILSVTMGYCLLIPSSLLICLSVYFIIQGGYGIVLAIPGLIMAVPLALLGGALIEKRVNATWLVLLAGLVVLCLFFGSFLLSQIGRG